MSKRTFVGVLIVALAVIVMAGGLLASNMGFKLNYHLAAAGVVPKESDAGNNTIALPDNRQSTVNFAKDLCNDIGGSAKVQSISRYNRINNGQTQFVCAVPLVNNFGLVSGDGYYVKMNTNQPVDYIIVGSDNPTLAYNLRGADGGVNSLNGTNFFAYNYHQTANTAQTLCQDIGGNAVVQTVQRFNTIGNNLTQHTCAIPAVNNFALVPGAAYFVKIQPNLNVNYVPSHY